MVEPVRPQVTIWRMRLALWMTKAADTYSNYVKFIFQLTSSRCVFVNRVFLLSDKLAYIDLLFVIGLSFFTIFVT